MQLDKNWNSIIFVLINIFLLFCIFPSYVKQFVIISVWLLNSSQNKVLKQWLSAYMFRIWLSYNDTTRRFSGLFTTILAATVSRQASWRFIIFFISLPWNFTVLHNDPAAHQASLWKVSNSIRAINQPPFLPTDNEPPHLFL